ncbi:hydroxymethylbilane synthase [Corynebacterium epidermidicanis]|uniref:Porphobilinogen deaminase n=1 Tax=Corynebacterium epidermidicanis TaxID=1050174 RepID=A0A0G3GWX0_9CORY|nr:hydroxymethylbilane synthase [Corynebacterium epidermidicanis]AKK04048.1 hydroxymethylbilane synthase [Corynebacterium epidermidicanis]
MLKIGTRGSKLATTQAGHIRDALIAAGYDAELTIITTPGDINMSPVERIGVGVFTQALREAMERGECDIAVHSFKDLPTAADPRFHLVVPERAHPMDVLIARDGLTLAELPEGARVGTSAPRRVSQLRAKRPDLDIQPLRGNIDTRMGKVTTGELDAVILAAAGLARIDQLGRATDIFDPAEFLPAPAQGALAVECRAGDSAVVEAIDTLADQDATAAAQAERMVLSTLEAGCTAPVAAYASVADGHIHLLAGVFALDGSEVLREEITGPVGEAASLGAELARVLLSRGAGDLVARA